MSGTNPTSIPTLEAYYPPGYPAGVLPPHPDAFHERPHALRAFSLDSTSSYSDMDDRNSAMTTQERSQRSRRRPQPGVQQVKHRRTRSGCYTCRQRRIKCDENRPTCDRCRKGKRECNYPGGPTSASKPSPKSQSKSSENEDESEQSEADLDDLAPELTAVVENVDNAATLSSSKAPSITTTDLSHGTSPASDGTVTSPTTTNASIPSTLSTKPPRGYRQDSHQSISSGIGQGARWLALPPDVRLLLTYHRDSLTLHHYSFRHDRNNFLKTTFLDVAINDQSCEALLYAVVAFASYHYTLAGGDAAISTFLSYYNRSIVLLAGCLGSRKPDISTLLTVLQLATIEEYLGEWGNMVGHQKAAHQILTELYTPQTIVRDATGLQILHWYSRLDIFNAMVAGGEVNLGREWFVAPRDHYRARSGGHNFSAKVDEQCATFLLMCSDLAAYMSLTPVDHDAARPNRNEFIAQFAPFREELETTLASLNDIERARTSAVFAGESMESAFGFPATSNRGNALCMHYLILDFLAVDLMMRHRVRQQTPTELATAAVKVIATIDSMDRNNDDPSVSLLNCRQSLVTATYFLSRETKYINWARQKFAMIEQLGCFYPGPLRRRVLALWGIANDEMWWPNDECTSPIVESIREFVQYRGSTQTDLDASSLASIG